MARVRMEHGGNPLIVTQKPSRSSLHHQDSVDSSDEYEDSVPPPCPPSPRSPPPSQSVSYPASIHNPTITVPETKKKQKKEKHKKRPFLFRRRKKESVGSLQAPSLRCADGLSSDSGSSFADVLMDPSLIRKRKGPGDRLLSLPVATITRSISDSAVQRVGLDTDEEDYDGEESRKGERELVKGRAHQKWLVHITLESGHGLAVRDRTGTSDPYVKFKCGQFKYRSTVVNRNLNPEWNEAFSFISTNLHLPLEINVYDHDYGSLDDYMGGGTVSLEGYTRGELHIVDIGLRDPNAREKSLGSIRIFLSISAHIDEPERPESTVPLSIQEWSSILTIHLLTGNDLPAMDDNGFSDPYCKFKLGRQKRRSKVVTRSLNPHWKEKFDMRMCHGDSATLHIEVWDRDLLQSDDFIGETSVNLDTLTQEQTHDLTLPLYPGNSGTIHLLLTITGTTAQEVEGDTATSNRSLWQSRSTADMVDRYALSRSLNFNLWNDIGHLTVIIDRLEGLGKSADVFAIAEVGNSQARTHTVYKTTSPFWGKAFHFDVRDIHSPLEVSVYSAKNKSELIGRVKIPLLRLELGVNKGYVLKNKHCMKMARGVLYLKCELVYQPVRAGLRTLKPRECKLMEKEAPFRRKVLMHNVKRITGLVNSLSAGMTWIRHISNWESKLHSSLALLGFILGCWVVQLWMLPLLVLAVFLVQYGLVYGKGRHVWQLQARRQSGTVEASLDRPPEEVSEEWSDLEDELEAASMGGGGGGKRKLREKFRQIQEILLIVQNVLGEIADTGERINNLFAWRVPFLCWLSIAILSIITVVTLLVPLRYIILVLGVNKLTKKLRKPNNIPHSELLDLISCSPSNHDLQEYRELPLKRPSHAPTLYRGHTRRHRSRSPQSRRRLNSQVKKSHTSAI